LKLEEIRKKAEQALSLDLTIQPASYSELAKTCLALIDMIDKLHSELGDIAMSECSEYVKNLADKALEMEPEVEE